MDDSLLDYYEKELRFLNRSAARFQKENPQAASQLGINKDTIADTHVEHLIQSVAFLNGRIRKKLDDDFPELNETLLDLLYPHYLKPIPSMTIARLTPQDGLGDAYQIPKGSLLESDTIDGDALTFRTAYPVTLWPFQITQAELVEGAYKAPPIPSYLDAAAVIKLQLTCDEEDFRFEDLAPDKIRFYIGGDEGISNKLYSLIFNHLVAVSVANNSLDTAPVYLDAACVKEVGFEEEDNLLEYGKRSFSGFRLLTEFFTFPKKFMFFDVTGLKDRLQGRGSRIEIFLYLNRTFPGVADYVNKSVFSLGCTPVVNLFRQVAEPIVASGQSDEYHVIPDSRRKLSREIYQIDKVSITRADGEETVVAPFYGTSHQSLAGDEGLYWHARRRNSDNHKSNQIDKGSEMHISLVNDNYLSASADKWVINVETLCLNRDMLKYLQRGTLNLHMRDGGLVETIECITPPTHTIRPGQLSGLRWRLISHLSINHIPLFDQEQTLTVLKEMLGLYNVNELPKNQAIINGIRKLNTRQIASRVRSHGNAAICRGIEVELVLDEERYKDQNMLLFASVLERFFALYAPMNSFTRLVLRTVQREEPIKKWTPRASNRQIA
ncbi:MAG: type VI secretion system baseplate subunit TssF [Gammaproteobacteria bacterium]|nr:type VI secretion system baseplate subunit TssF [Gammaproteobacteria bacterium]